MVNFLRKKFIKDYENVKNQKVRQAHGKMACIAGIISNLFLFIIKVTIGILTFSMSIITDSINNLSDMASSIISLVGFKLASAPADKEHPYGHERMEYLAGFIVAIIIVMLGGILGYTSIMKVIFYTYEPINYVYTYISIGILSLAILIKLWQSLFYKKIAKLIDSTALHATSADSRNDCITTLLVLIGTIVVLILELNSIQIPFSLDGILGAGVSIFIIVSGIMLIKETANPLIGNSVSKEYVDDVLKYIKSFDNVLGYHDVMCHMYGPTRCYMTIHVEISSATSLVDAHEIADLIETEVRKKYDIELSVHIDPLEVGNPRIDYLYGIVMNSLYEIDDKLTFHDFRVVKKEKETILFDIVVPYKYKMSNDEITNYINNKLKDNNIDCALLINYDHEYIGD